MHNAYAYTISSKDGRHNGGTTHRFKQNCRQNKHGDEEAMKHSVKKGRGQRNQRIKKSEFCDHQCDCFGTCTFDMIYLICNYIIHIFPFQNPPIPFSKVKHYKTPCQSISLKWITLEPQKTLDSS